MPLGHLPGAPPHYWHTHTHRYRTINAQHVCALLVPAVGDSEFIAWGEVAIGEVHVYLAANAAAVRDVGLADPIRGDDSHCFCGHDVC